MLTFQQFLTPLPYNLQGGEGNFLLFCLRSSTSKYNTSTIKCLFIFTLQPKLKRTETGDKCYTKTKMKRKWAASAHSSHPLCFWLKPVSTSHYFYPVFVRQNSMPVLALNITDCILYFLFSANGPFS